MSQQLSKREWTSLLSSHQTHIRRWSEPFRQRRRKGKSHPIHDFLFVYYRYSPAKLEQWHPGAGVDLILDSGTTPKWLAKPPYKNEDGLISLDYDAMDQKQFNRLKWTVDLLQQTAARRGNFSCFGMHEWAMVYNGDEVRHDSTTPMRLTQLEIDEFVQSRPMTCTHFDAFRFFADTARPLNRIQPQLDTRIELEQPACIHANMDLYKWAFKAMPWVGSNILRECFELALQAREIDMRASPYDLSDFRLEPVQIETPEGRAEYERLQRTIFEKAQPLREKLVKAIEIVIHHAGKARPA